MHRIFFKKIALKIFESLHFFFNKKFASYGTFIKQLAAIVDAFSSHWKFTYFQYLMVMF